MPKNFFKSLLNVEIKGRPTHALFVCLYVWARVANQLCETWKTDSLLRWWSLSRRFTKRKAVWGTGAEQYWGSWTVARGPIEVWAVPTMTPYGEQGHHPDGIPGANPRKFWGIYDIIDTRMRHSQSNFDYLSFTYIVTLNAHWRDYKNLP